LDTARRAASAGLPGVYMYNFDIDWSISPQLFGACHTSEISHVFGTPYMVTGMNAAVADAMNRYWGAFARTGNPNFDGAPGMWPAFGPDAMGVDSRIQFDLSPGYETLTSFRKDECQLWADYAAAQP
ncbi:MAG TPA: carboxylesterase family protein, partial [Polyangiaceae bacterium]|nr:carboxylesterase family protein [Polyangiaceae bacterium]